jgi:hypothetical protein
MMEDEIDDFDTPPRDDDIDMEPEEEEDAVDENTSFLLREFTDSVRNTRSSALAVITYMAFFAIESLREGKIHETHNFRNFFHHVRKPSFGFLTPEGARACTPLAFVRPVLSSYPSVEMWLCIAEVFMKTLYDVCRTSNRAASSPSVASEKMDNAPSRRNTDGVEVMQDTSASFREGPMPDWKELLGYVLLVSRSTNVKIDKRPSCDSGSGGVVAMSGDKQELMRIFAKEPNRCSISPQMHAESLWCVRVTRVDRDEKMSFFSRSSDSVELQKTYASLTRIEESMTKSDPRSSSRSKSFFVCKEYATLLNAMWHCSNVDYWMASESSRWIIKNYADDAMKKGGWSNLDVPEMMANWYKSERAENLSKAWTAHIRYLYEYKNDIKSCVFDDSSSTTIARDEEKT